MAESAVQGQARPETFQRRATGLVREAGTLDVLVYNMNFISLGLMAALVFLFSTAFYPGANLYVTSILIFLVVIPTSLVFAFFASAMPRSGADYVYVSRVLHPALGMMSSWNNTAWWFIYGGVPSAFSHSSAWHHSSQPWVRWPGSAGCRIGVPGSHRTGEPSSPGRC